MQLKTLIFMVLLLSGLAFPLGIAGCGPLAAGTAYDLTANIINSSVATCFTTLGDGVSFDGHGYVIDGIGAGSVAFFSTNNNFVVRNVIISDYSYMFSEQGNNNAVINATLINASVTGVYQCCAAASCSNFFYNNVSINGTTTSGGIWIRYNLCGGYSTGVVLANSSINSTSGPSLYLEKTNATIVNTYLNNTVYQTGTSCNTTYYNVTSSAYNFTVAANVTSDIFFDGIINTSAILVKPYNHDTGARINYANYTVTSSTSNIMYDLYWLMLDYRNGANTSVIVSENTNYYPSYLVGDAPFENGFGDQILLMPKTASNLATVIFHIVSSSNTPISGVTCGAFKAGTSAWMLLGAKKTDATGVFGLIMQTTTQYKLICSASGFLTYTTYLTPVSSDYTITLSSTTYGLGFPTSIDGVRYSFNQSLGVAWNVTQTFNFTVFNTSANSSLDWFSMAVYNGTTLLYSSNDTTHPSGYSITYTFMPGNNSNISVLFGLKRQSRDGIVWSIKVPTYYGYTSSGGASLTDALSSLSSLGSLTIVFLTLIVGAIVGGYAAQISAGAGVVAFMGILTMGFLISSTIMSGALLLVAFVVAGGYFILRGGG